MVKQKILLNNIFAIGIVITFIVICIQPGITALDFDVDKFESHNNESVEIITQIFNHGRLKEIKSEITIAEAKNLKINLGDLHDTIKQGDKKEIKQAYDKIENKNIFGSGFLNIVTKYQELLNDNESLFALVLAKANSSQKIPTALLIWAFSSLLPPP